MADPTRRSILRRLAAGAAPVRDLAAPFRMSQQAVSKHLALLERARLIVRRRSGRMNLCSLRPAPLAEVAGWADGFRALWEANYRRLDTLLEELQSPTPRKPKRTRRA